MIYGRLRASQDCAQRNGIVVGWRWAERSRLSRDTHLSDDEAVAKMGHPVVGVRLEGWAEATAEYRGLAAAPRERPRGFGRDDEGCCCVEGECVPSGAEARVCWGCLGRG